MRDFLHHLFLPRESNNHRARILHHPSLLAIIVFLLVLELSFSFLHAKRSDVLGIKTDIAITDLLLLTNQKRAESGLPPLVINQELSQAAAQKASDMFAKDYWAHNSPDGTTPWIFIKAAGYDYLYAGENLARGFTSSSDVIDAWMASPGHRENMLSPNYNDIGFAVVPGSLTGDETILVVEEFGQRRGGEAEVAEAKPAEVADARVPSQGVQRLPQQSQVAAFQTTPLLDVKQTTKGVAIVILGVVLMALLLDIFLAERKKIVRIVAHNIDTMLFLGVILVAILLIGNGLII